MRYKCESRIIGNRACEFECCVDTEFEPRGCLYAPVSEVWKRVEPNFNNQKETENDTICIDSSSVLFDLHFGSLAGKGGD